MSQQNSSNNTNDASPSRDSAPHQSPGERLPASEGTNLQFELDAQRDQEQKLQKVLLECEKLRNSENEMMIALARSQQAVEDEKERTKHLLLVAEDTAAELDRLRLQNAVSERQVEDLMEQLTDIVFGHEPAGSEPAGSIPSTMRYRPRQSPGESPIFCYGPNPSPVDETSASGGESLDGPGNSAQAPPAADSLPPFLRRRSLSPAAFRSPDTIRVVAGAFGFGAGHSAPGSPSPAAVEQRHYCRPRSMSCPELLNPIEDWAEYLDFAGYCAFVEILRVGCSHSPRLSRASGEPYGQPGSYSPVQGFGPHGAGIFHGPGFHGYTFMYSSPPSSSIPPPTQQSDRELLEPRQFIELFLPRRLTQQHFETELSCSAHRDMSRCPVAGDSEDFEVVRSS